MNDQTDQKIVISATLGDIQKLLELEYDFEPENAKLAALVLLDASEDIDTDNSGTDSLELWYDKGDSAFTTPVPYINDGFLNISLTGLKAEILQLIVENFEAVVKPEKDNILFAVIKILSALFRRFSVVEDPCKCIYLNILSNKEICRGILSFAPFDANKVIPLCQESICCYLDKTYPAGKRGDGDHWLCCYRSGEECSLVKKAEEDMIQIVRSSLNRMVAQNILKATDDGKYIIKK